MTAVGCFCCKSPLRLSVLSEMQNSVPNSRAKRRVGLLCNALKTFYYKNCLSGVVAEFFNTMGSLRTCGIPNLILQASARPTR